MSGPSEEPEEAAVEQIGKYFDAYALTVRGLHERQRADFLLVRAVPLEFDGKIKVRIVQSCPREDGGLQVWVVMFVDMNKLLPVERRNMDAFYELHGGKLEGALRAVGFDFKRREVDMLEFVVPYRLMR